jgi:hypothetical protein
MVSQKLSQILRAKSTFTEAEIGKLSEHAGWNWVYANMPPKNKRGPWFEICFSGFGLTEKVILSSRATAAGHRVVGSVTKGLTFLCVGENPGASKVQKAQDQHVRFLSRQQFVHLIETGELPLDY